MIGVFLIPKLLLKVVPRSTYAYEPFKEKIQVSWSGMGRM